MRLKVALLTTLGLMFLAAIPVQAQQWTTSALIYIWGAGMDGTVATSGASVEVDQGFGDVLENLEFGLFGGLKARNGNWSIGGDFMYVGLGATVEGPLSNPIEVDVDQWMVTGDVGYRVAPKIDVLAGARIVSLQTKLQFSGPIGIEAEGDRTWVDPIVGIRLEPRLSETWSVLTRFDFGGFDVGSDFTSHLNANVVWQFSEKMAFAAGYRVIDIKYDDEEGNEEFVYDVTSHGPIAGFVYTF